MRLIPVDVRVIAATHRDLAEAVEAGTFRKDLYYRLCACPLHVPPLRHRLEDIPLLINHFLGNLGAPPVDLPPDLLSELSTFDWPGNVRQLENLVRYAYAISGGSPPEFCEAMREVVRNSRRRPTEANIRKILQELQSSAPLPDYLALLRTLYRAETQGRRPGRARLARELMAEGRCLTAGQVRARLNMLSKCGCVQIGRGRQGTALTSLGHSLILELETATSAGSFGHD